MDALQTTRNQLFVFVRYMPPTKLDEARRRIEAENVNNKEEFDGDDDAGVYKPRQAPVEIAGQHEHLLLHRTIGNRFWHSVKE
jgi:hypothetical protein